MNTTAEILRDCAYGLPNADDSDVCILSETGEPRTTSPFICDHLDRMDDDSHYRGIGAVAHARIFLRELGMGTGMAEFISVHDSLGFTYGVEHQTMRAVFLLFAADLAEEWDV